MYTVRMSILYRQIRMECSIGTQFKEPPQRLKQQNPPRLIIDRQSLRSAAQKCHKSSKKKTKKKRTTTTWNRCDSHFSVHIYFMQSPKCWPDKST